jgi:hypothetical protein
VKYVQNAFGRRSEMNREQQFQSAKLTAALTRRQGSVSAGFVVIAHEVRLLFGPVLNSRPEARSCRISDPSMETAFSRFTLTT